MVLKKESNGKGVVESSKEESQHTERERESHKERWVERKREKDVASVTSFQESISFLFLNL